VITLRCTTQLRQRLGVVDTDDAPPSGLLGDWYAKIVATRPRHLVLCTNERTLLCVVVPFAPRNTLRERFAATARHRIDQIAAPAELRLAEIDAIMPVRIGRTTSRSVLSSLNEFGYAVEAWLEDRSADDLEALGLWLCDTPCFPLKTHWPWLEAELLLTGTVAPGRKPPKFLEVRSDDGAS
jgi:hypothetical protein